MWAKPLCIFALSLVTAVTGVVAERVLDEDPVLRLRLTDRTPAPVRMVKLRPRFDTNLTSGGQMVPMPKVRVQDSGPVGKFAFVSTPHPNLVVAVGSTEDRSEIGRQIDRAVIEMGGAKPLFDHARDRAPFIGVGVQTKIAKTGWSMDATVGANFINRAEQVRTFGALDLEQSAALEAKARANFRLRYRF